MLLCVNVSRHENVDGCIKVKTTEIFLCLH
jgi:hypothetical protein